MSSKQKHWSRSHAGFQRHVFWSGYDENSTTNNDSHRMIFLCRLNTLLVMSTITATSLQTSYPYVLSIFNCSRSTAYPDSMTDLCSRNSSPQISPKPSVSTRSATTPLVPRKTNQRKIPRSLRAYNDWRSIMNNMGCDERAREF